MAGEDFSATVPPAMKTALDKVATVPSWNSLYPLLRNQLIQAPLDCLTQTYQMAEGLEHRMKEVAQRSLRFDDFIHGVKTKRYTYAHLLRMCLYTTLQLSEDEVAARVDHPYIHILGFTARGREYLHQVKSRFRCRSLPRSARECAMASTTLITGQASSIRTSPRSSRI